MRGRDWRLVCSYVILWRSRMTYFSATFQSCLDLLPDSFWVARWRRDGRSVKTVKCLILPILHKPLDITRTLKRMMSLVTKLWKVSYWNIARPTKFNRHLMQCSFGGKIGLWSAAPLAIFVTSTGCCFWRPLIYFRPKLKTAKTVILTIWFFCSRSELPTSIYHACQRARIRRIGSIFQFLVCFIDWTAEDVKRWLCLKGFQEEAPLFLGKLIKLIYLLRHAFWNN